MNDGVVAPAEASALSALLVYIAQVRDRKLAEIKSASDRQCHALRGAARDKAREQIRQALREERRDADTRIAIARASAQARVRRARQALTLSALERVRARVEDGLRARWASRAGRATWIAMAVAEAARHLPAGAWTVWHAGETPALGPPRDGVKLEFRPAEKLDAGLRIACNGAEVDATIDGLLRSGDRIAGLWLGELERLRAAEGAREAA